LKSLVPVAALLIAAPALAQVSVPQQLAYEGRLAAVDGGAPITGTHSIQFAIWPTSSGGGNSLWYETHSVTVVNGLYSVTLGTTDGGVLPPTLFDGTVRYLEITVDSDTLSPRQPIGSVPYSILSGGVQGGTVNATAYQFKGNPLVTPAGRTLVSSDAGMRSVFGLFCNSSAATNGDISDLGSQTTGYRATKIICEKTCGDPSAHMCSPAELVASSELALPPLGDEYWCSSGVEANTGGLTSLDCGGWTYGTATYGGAAWASGPGYALCSTMNPIACCE
jgi:hypothetical protein